MNKFYFYLSFKHSWKGINCLTLIEKIYSEHLNVSFLSLWKRINRVNGTDNVDRKWFISNKDILIKETQNWKRINLQDTKEYDILVFTNRKNIIDHFGMYIGNNNFIHCQENKYVTISLLDEEWRERLYGIFRHPLVL